MTQVLDVRWLAAQLGAKLVGAEDLQLHGVLPLARATPKHLSFFADLRYRAALAESAAGAVLVPEHLADLLATTPAENAAPRAWLGVSAPALAASRAAALFCPPWQAPAGVHPSAVVHKTAQLAQDVHVGALVVVEEGAQVAAGSVLEAHSFVGRNAQLGRGVWLHPGARVLHGCHIGDGSILHPGAVVGSDGFGYSLEPGSAKRRKVPQLGNVVLGKDVELGANTTVDRATFGSTRIGDGSKIDNLVMVAHNVELGQDCVLVSQTGIAGSTQLGDRVVAGAQSGLVGHIEIGSDVHFAARSGVNKSIAEPGAYGGLPVMPQRAWLRMVAAVRHVADLRQEVRQLAHSVARLVASSSQQGG